MNAPTQQRHRVLVADKLSDDGLALFAGRERFDVSVKTQLDEAGLVAAARDADAILVRSGARITAAVIAAAPNLRVIGRAGIGVDNVDVAAATARGIVVMNCPDANADTTSEHTLALLFALARALPAADRSLRDGRWEKNRFLGVELTGKVLGILGGGNIGQRVARKAQGLGLEPIVHDPYLAPEALRDLHVAVLPLDVVLAKSDFLSIHVPLSEKTRHFVDARMFARMKRGVLLVNCARGGIVDETALAAALDSGQVGGAALDVFEQEPPPKDHPLLARENVVVTPHLGASTREAQARASLEICRQVIAFLDAGEAQNAVNLPRLPRHQFQELAPWLDLATRLGRAVAALADFPIERIEVSFHGRLCALDTATVTRAVVSGVLEAGAASPINVVNAMRVAESRGVAVEERRSERMRDFASMLTAQVIGGARRIAVSGTLFGVRQPRIVKIDDWSLEAIAEGMLLVVQNLDRPGVIGHIGTLLGAAGVNIRAMHLAPPKLPGEPALAVLNVDQGLSESVLVAIRALPEITGAWKIDLA